METDGGLTVEAALVLPLFLAFVITLGSLIQMAILEDKLQSALTECTKEMATHMGPVETIYLQAKAAASETAPAILLRQTLERIRSVRDTTVQAEDWVQRMGNFIPEPVLELVEWEQKRREELEKAGKDKSDELVHKTLNPLINQAFKPIVLHYADTGILKADQFRIVHVDLPNLGDHDKAYLGITAEYEWKLPIPFLRKTIRLRKTAWERAWLGE